MNEFSAARTLYKGGLFLVAIVVLVLLGLELKWVLVQLFAAAIVAAGMAPIVTLATYPEGKRWRGWRPSPVLVVVAIYIVVGLVVSVLGVLLVQAVLAQGTLLLERAPNYAVEVQNWYAYLARRWTPLEELDVFDLLGGTSGLTQWIVDGVRQLLGVGGLLLATLGGALNVVFVLFIALYLTIDARSIRDYLLVFVPLRRREQARRIAGDMTWRLGQWVIGQLILCFIVGLGAGIVLALIGVPAPSLLALVWAIGVVIPGIGPFISAVPTILLGFGTDVTTGVLATIFAVVWSQLENNVLVPRVMGHTVKLNPLVVLVAMLIGKELLGWAGALFAIPLAATLAVVVDELHRERLLAEAHAEMDVPIPG
jgi:predicted PurR-regulated permease PerM